MEPSSAAYVSGAHDNFPPCPSWCTRQHGRSDPGANDLELVEGYREHAVQLAEFNLPDGGRASVDLVRGDQLGAAGENRVLVVCEDLATPAIARELAAATLYAASMAEGAAA